MRPARLFDTSLPDPEWVVGNEHGMITLRQRGSSLLGVALHSPVPVPCWSQEDLCPRMERSCWYRSTWEGYDAELFAVWNAAYRADEEGIWRLLEQAHAILLEGR